MRNHLTLSLQTSSLSSDADYDAKQTRVTIDKELLQLIQSACKSDNLARAFDLANLLINPGSVDGAARIAAFYQLGGLEERILGIKGEAAVRAKREEKRAREREEERKRRYGADHSVLNGAATAGTSAKSGMELGFQPRDKPRRSFGGVKAGVGAGAGAGVPSSRAETPQNGVEAFIPETPSGLDGVQDTYADRESMDVDGQGSPESKRKRADDEAFAPRRRLEEGPMSSMPLSVIGHTLCRDHEYKGRFQAQVLGTVLCADESDGATGAKNPFAKKAAAGNPFAKPAASKPLDAIKSKSFFARVDDIESSKRG
jgi:chromosome transmission fidelity protein 4